MSRHPPFKDVEASRPPWHEDVGPTFTRTRKPDWKPGGGANDHSFDGKKHVEIDPYAPGRNPNLNYKLLISAIVPRPIGFMSTLSKDGLTANLSPFSFFQMFSYDPPLFVFGIVGNKLGVHADQPNSKDSLRNVLDTGECVINIISEHFLEAANFTCINAPYGVSEFDISGLHQAPSVVVRAPRVKEAVFSIEAKLVEKREYQAKLDPTHTTATMLVVEGVRFWAREDAVDDQGSLIDIDKLRPIARLGGITYARVTELIELPRPEWEIVRNGEPS
ncbi:flavoprotein oxygenase [Xylogone sp. PMI_703]|nr:flavoprotein oxygenase [Xylogone sp. PMI_703]